eukprot:1082058-Ditylum_brightwellii.AAC.1
METILQGNCNAGVSTFKGKGAYRLWSFWINKKAASPAAEHLFEVCKDDKDKLLPEEQALAFHCTTA